MAFCNITKESLDLIIQLTYNRVYNNKFTDLKQEMMNLYNIKYNEAKDNKIEALTYAGLVPTILLKIAMDDINMLPKIRKVISVDDLFDIKSQMTDNLGETNKFLFAKESTFTPDEAKALIQRLDDINTFPEFDKAVKDVDVNQYLKEPGNEELRETYFKKWQDLFTELETNLIRQRDAALAKLQAEEIKAAEEIGKDDVPEIPDQDEYTEEEEKEIVSEEDIIEPVNALAFNTPNKSVNRQIKYDENSKPDDEIPLNPNEYDTQMSNFYNKNKLIDGNFDLSLQNDTDELINKRFLGEEQRKEALETKGQIIVFKLKDGTPATFGNTKTITDEKHSLYNAPIITSVNKKAFNKYFELRAIAYSDRYNMTFQDVINYYNEEMEKLQIARMELEHGDVREYPITVIHQSRGVLELTDEGSIASRFRSGDNTALKGFKVLKRDETLRGSEYKKGQIVVEVKRKDRVQSFAASAPKISDLKNETGKQIKDAITFYLYKSYKTKEEATQLINSFFKNVLYTKKNAVTLRAVLNKSTREFNIVYSKKDKKGSMIPVVSGQIGKERINISEKLISSDSLQIPSTNGVISLESQDYEDFIKENLVTSRKAVIDNQGNFHLDLVNPYFSFALDLSNPGVHVDSIAKVEKLVGEELHTYEIHYMSNRTTKIFENGKELSINALPIARRYEITQLVKPEDKIKTENPNKFENSKTFEDEEKQKLEDFNSLMNEDDKTDQAQPEVKQETQVPLTNEPKIVTKRVSTEDNLTKNKALFKIDKTRFSIDISDDNPFHDSFAYKNKKISKDDAESIKNALLIGNIPSNLALLISGDYFIIGTKSGGIYKVFDNNLNVVPDSFVSQDDINKYNEQNPCK